jgi:hypothetical protein
MICSLLNLSYYCRLDFFGEVEPTADNHYSPSRNFTDNDKNSQRGRWSDLVDSLEERVASGSRTLHGTAEGRHAIEYLASNPALAVAINNIIHSPNNDRPVKDLLEVGTWVQVRRGIYKGDVGYVSSVAASTVHLLLIPRLPPLDQSHSKRKPSLTRPTLKLFGHEPLILDDDNERHEKVYSWGKHKIEHGLIAKSYNFDSVSTPVSTIPLQLFVLFLDSRHPKIPKTSFPRPSEWNFTENEKVYILDDESIPSSRKPALFSTSRRDSAELETDEGIVVVPWITICKAIEIGDFVEVTSGLRGLQKDQGWVDQVDLLYTRMANIIRMPDEGKPFSDHPEVRPISNHCPHRNLNPVRLSLSTSMY